MIISNKIRSKIAHFGAFDHDSYGDLIFPFIAEYFLPEFELIHVSPSGKSTPWSDAKKTISINDAFKIEDWDGVLVGGGDIIQSAEGFIWNDSALQSLGALRSLWSGASLLSAKLDIPCAWNSPGVPADLPDPTLSMAQDSIQCVDYLAVRDKLSADRINRLVNHPLHIVPDTALAISEIWKRSHIKENKNKPLILSLTPMDIEQRMDEIESLIRKITKNNGFSGEIIVLPLMEWQKSNLLHKFVNLKNEFNFVVKDRSLTLQECAFEISNGRAYVGNSLHGLITALSYGVPAVHVKPVGFNSVTKYQGFAKHFPNGEQLLAENFSEAYEKITTYRNIKIDNGVQLIHEHFGCIKNALNDKKQSKKIKWDSVAKARDVEAQNLLMHGYSAYQLLNDRNKHINNRDGQIFILNQAVTERDGQINSLNQAVTERDGQIASLNQAVTERHGQINSLNQAVTERDGQIAILSQAVTERHGQINSLNQAVTERDGQIASLSQAVTERHGQINSLNQAVTERDGQIASLSQAVTERDGQITSLNQAVTERDGQIASLSQAVTERHGQINSLNQAVTERDGQIASLSQAVTERDGQITSLNQAVTERDGQIANLIDEAGRIVIGKDWEIRNLQQQLNQILHSRSWRVTAPLREVILTIRQGVRSPRMSYLGKIAEYLQIRRDLILRSTVRQIRNSPLFDTDYYFTNYPDVRDAGMDPTKHYLFHGWKEHRNPSASFSTSQYLFDNPDVERARVNPLLHYLRYGRLEGRPIRLQKSALEVTSSPASVHLVSVSQQELVEVGDLSVAHGHENVSNAAIDTEVVAIRKSGLFDESFYRSMYTDIQPVPRDSIRHYCEYGWREGRNPSDDFDTRFYLATYSDIRNAGINPFWHYVVAGATEMRHAIPDSATRHENDIQFGVVDTDIKLLAFYSSPDWTTLRSGRPMFKGHSQQPLPHDEFGFYDPSDWRVLKHQAELAKRHGLYGFCFDLGIGANGTTLSQPVDIFLAHDDIDFRFCLQAELGSENILKSLIASLARAVTDRRYIRIADRPIVLFTMPDERRRAASVLGQLRRQLADQGVGSPFLIERWASAGEVNLDATMADLCDAVLDLPSAPVPGEIGDFLPLDKNGVNVVPYGVVASQGVARARKAHGSAYPLYHAVTLGRDNAAQRPERPLVYTRFHVRDYRRWLDAAFVGARVAHPEDRRFVFVKGWNDWNEGLFLEPDRQGGFGRVNETTRALLNIASGAAMPKVSVIVPNYNHERFLCRRLNSIYGQTYKNIEVILLDDCSSDQSRSVLDQYAADYPEITRTLYNDENSGGAFRQWAKGIKAATGDLVWIAESDDYCDERLLEVLVRCFEDEAVLLAYAKSTFVDKNEVPIRDDFQNYLSDLECAEKWNGSYVETAHNEVRSALGIKNTIPNASGVLFKRPINMPLLDDESWLSMVVAGDWVFYLQLIRGGKIAYSTETTNFFRRYEGSAAEVTYKKEVFYREVGMASRTVAALYKVPLAVLEQCRRTYRTVYENKVGGSNEEFALWYDYQYILKARESRLPNVMVSTMGFFPGGAEILPIRLANEFKRQGLSVLLLNAGLNPREDGVRRMLRNDVPVIETSSVEDVKAIIRDFGVEVLNTHQWHIQKYPLQVADVFDELRGHVASLHGMIEHGDAFGVTEEQLRKADQSVTTWVYTAEKNLGPFSSFGLYDKSSSRFVKIPNGMQPPQALPIPRTDMGIPEDAFVLCCVSRAIPDKGWAETIQVVERARVISGRDIRLILVGNGPVYDEYCRIGTPDFVYLAGFSENSVGHYAAADMGVMLTKFKSESFPLTIVDCLFAGKPYIASDVGDIRNMLTAGDDVAGEVIKLEDWEVPIERAAQVVAAFATDKQKYVNALVLVQDVANRYRIDVVASQYVRLFESSPDENRLLSSGRRN